MQPPKGPGADLPKGFPATRRDRRRFRRPSARPLATASAAALLLLYGAVTRARAGNVVSTWNDGAAGDWSDPANWVNDPPAATFPNNGNLGNTYDVSINSGTAAVNVPVRVGGLSLTGATRLVLSSDLTTTGPTLLGGVAAVSGAGRVSASDLTVESVRLSGGAELNVAAGGTMTYGLVGGGATLGGGARLTVDGTANWHGLKLLADTATAARLEVRAGGVLDVRPSAAASLGQVLARPVATADVLSNAGEIRVDRASLSVEANWSLDNAGTFRATGGASVTLASQFATNSGTIELGGGAAMLLAGDWPTNKALPEFRVTSTGVFRVGTSSTLSLDTPANFAQFNNFGLVEVNGGRIVNQDYGMTNSGTLRLSDGGSAELGRYFLNTGQVDVRGGRIDVSAGRTTNAGRIDLSAGAVMSVRLGDAWGTAFRNRAGATITVGKSALLEFAGSGPNLASNAGSIQVDGGQFTLSEKWQLNNTGSIVVTAGVMKLAYGGSFTNTGHVDLRDGGAFILAVATGSPVTTASRLKTARDMILTGYHAGAWDGPGVRSASAAVDPTTAVGYAPVTVASRLLGVGINPDDVVVRHTKKGDATLDGVVNFDDLLALAKSYNATGVHWYQGDFSYDGTVNFDDLLILAKNYNGAIPGGAAAPGPVLGATAEFNADVAAAFARAVPEPALDVVAVTACAASLLGRRRRRVGA